MLDGEIAMDYGDGAKMRRATPSVVPAAWLKFIRYCEQIGHGDIERLKIQDGLPVLAEVIREKVKFS
jgi:hypothetical protein